MPWTANDVRIVEIRLLPAIYDINQRIKYDRNTRRLSQLLSELDTPEMNIRLRELANWRESQKSTPLPAPPSPIEQAAETKRGYVSITGLQSGVLKAKLAEIKTNAQKRLADGVAKIENAHSSGLARVDAEMDGVVKKINKEIDDQLQEFAEFSNGGPPLDN